MALILGRRPSETVVITTPAGEEILATVLIIRGFKVSLRIDSNVSLNVDRTEKLRLHQTLFINTPSGQQIEVFPLTMRNSQVHLGINANRDVAVDREEIHRRKQAEAAWRGVA